MDKEIIKIQSKIQRELHSNNGVTVHFSCEEKHPSLGEGFELELSTYNPKNDEVFLLHSLSDESKILVYKSMDKYIKTLIDCINNPKNYDSPTNEDSTIVGSPWTVEWSYTDGKTQKSFFHGKDPEEVIKKFYHGKEKVKHFYKIYSITLNPIS